MSRGFSLKKKPPCTNRNTARVLGKCSNATAGDFDSQAICWQYDAFGNRLAQVISSASFSAGSGGASACQAQSTASVSTSLATYNSKNQVIETNARGVIAAPSYDAAGNMLSDGANTYLYDAEGRICATENVQLSGYTIMTGYLYDADGNRVAKGTIASMNCDPTKNGFTFTSLVVCLEPTIRRLCIFT